MAAVSTALYANHLHLSLQTNNLADTSSHHSVFPDAKPTMSNH